MKRCALKKVFVLIGNFGSGKTELALNFAFRAAKNGCTLLIDLDMVNTYFRLTERKKLIETAQIKLISPNYAMTNVEALSLPAETATAFDANWDTVIFDVGGDGAGATALGRYKTDFDVLDAGQLEVLHVVNIRRPMSGTADKIIRLADILQNNSRLSLAGFINNTNLAHMTGPDELRDGYELLCEVSDKTGLPVLYTTGKKNLLDMFLSENHDARYIGTPMELVTYMHRDWDSFTKNS